MDRCPVCLNTRQDAKTPNKKALLREFSHLEREQARLEAALHDNLVKQHKLKQRLREM